MPDDIEEREISKEERDKAGGGDFAGKNRSFPILKPEDVAAAAASLGRAGSDNYSTDQIKANIIRIAKRKGAAFVAKLPAAWKESAMPEEIDGDLMPLMERAVANDGTIEMRLIRPGWGASGYYPKEVLERDGPNVWPAGTHMYLDHPTTSEMAERPERSIRDLAAVTISNPVYQENGKVGPGLYAKATVLPQWKETIDALAPFIGVSIRASGSWEAGEAEGREGKVIKKLAKGHSVDFVTQPGAGGKVLQVMESLRAEQARQSEPSTVVSTEAVDTNAVTTSTTGTGWTYVDNSTGIATVPYVITESTSEEDDSMAELEEAQTRITELETELAESKKAEQGATERAERAEGALRILEAQGEIRQMLENVSLPAAAKTRIVSKLSLDAPVKDGALDKEALKEAVDAEAKVEAEYIEAVTPQGKVTDQGATGSSQNDVKESLTKNLSSFFKLNPEAAKQAVEGR